MCDGWDEEMVEWGNTLLHIGRTASSREFSK